MLQPIRHCRSREFTITMELLGKPWVAGGRGPDSFDCWGLCAYVYEHTMRAPQCALDGFANPGATMVTGWSAKASPAAFCVVLMKQRGGGFHAGIWLDADGGGILHCMPTCGTVFTRRDDIHRLGLDITGFYTYDNIL